MKTNVVIAIFLVLIAIYCLGSGVHSFLTHEPLYFRWDLDKTDPQGPYGSFAIGIFMMIFAWKYYHKQ